MWDGFDLPGAIRHELRGFGQTPLPPAGEFSHADDLEAALGGEPAVLVGASFGGLGLPRGGGRAPRARHRAGAARRPAARPRLVATRSWRYRREEDGLLEQGDLRGAAILNADFWLTSPEPRERVIEMQERAFELQAESEAEGTTRRPSTCGAITARTLVAVGELDRRDFHEIAERLAREIPDARHAVIEGAGHLPALERPEETARLVREFLA